MPGVDWRNERPQSRQRLLRTCKSTIPRRKPQSSCRTVLRHQPLFRRRDPPHCGHDIGPVYRADIVIVPPFCVFAVISYWGRPKSISESVKALSPKIVLPIWDHGLPPQLIKSHRFGSKTKTGHTGIRLTPTLKTGLPDSTDFGAPTNRYGLERREGQQAGVFADSIQEHSGSQPGLASVSSPLPGTLDHPDRSISPRS